MADVAEGWQEVSTGCENPRPGRYVVNRVTRRYLHIGCDRWRCKGCARRKSYRVQKRMLTLEATDMLTLTLPPDRGAPTAENLRYLHERRRFFFRWLQRQKKWGLKKQGWILEVGERGGRLHLHCLAKFKGRPGLLPYAEIQKVAERLGLGVVDIAPIWRQETAVRYVAKYMAKSLSGTLDAARGEGGFAARGTGDGPETKDLDAVSAPLPSTVRRFGMTQGHTLPKDPDWNIATREDCLPIEPSPLRLVLGDPMYAAPGP